MRPIQQSIIFLITSLVLCVSDVQATDHESGIWAIASISRAFGPAEEPSPWRWSVQGQARKFSLLDGTRQGIIRGGIGYQISPNVTLWGGYAYYHTRVVNVGSTYGNRLWQQVNWTMGRWGWGTLKSRTRMEQRFREGRDGMGWWVRQQFRIDAPFGESGKFSFILGNESFIYLKETTWNDQGYIQNRLFTGLGYKASPKVTMELGYMNQHVRIRESADLINHLAILNFKFK